MAPTTRAQARRALPLDEMDQGKSGKESWDAVAHRIFLDICVEEVRRMNGPTQCLDNVGYRSLATKFNERTKGNYELKQFKDRWETLKNDYNIWKSLNQHASGLRRDPLTGTIAASNDWWDSEIQKCPEAEKFRTAPLDNEDKMRIIFDAHSVTNEHAVVLGATCHVGTSHVNLEEDESGSGSEGTPVGGNVTKKRTTEHSPTPTPSKRRTDRDSLLDPLLDLFDKETSENSVTYTSQMSIDPVRKDITEIMALVVEDGADELSDEFFFATQLFVKKKYRDVFITMKTPNGRLAWIRRTWEEKKKRWEEKKKH